jgi:hypothetical protein
MNYPANRKYKKITKKQIVLDFARKREVFTSQTLLLALSPDGIAQHDVNNAITWLLKHQDIEAIGGDRYTLYQFSDVSPVNRALKSFAFLKKKVCAKCGIEKSWSEFSETRKTCMKCRNDGQKKTVKKVKEPSYQFVPPAESLV